MKVSGVILSGGRSSRMGKNKAVLPFGNETVIERIADQMETYDEWFVIANDADQYQFLGCPVYGDYYIDQGPLAGIEAALSHSVHNVCAVTACDTPFADRRVYDLLLEQINTCDVVIPIYNGRMHPLSGVYSKSVLPVIRQQLTHNERKIRSFFDHVHVQYVSDLTVLPKDIVDWHFFNMNTPEEYETARARLKL
ncbi:Molybdenum cofactor guanylyltransferase [Lentibacillus sp. JNUCC-1]|uniref:molybdenum cofactor guanylyltransferase n=1 Tax=Lentibacillus sp. JNUCC-1 TaxID=2654513 RepID=UPI001321E4E4|nr:molybdenum cofactor guanylyltransferase [Lentibacillus sp. JNUCC-1]MUV39825.1 Molybdenum cofactor guanylyltransferase [Lentibacillus sp. JNUCC-1]